jgi:putative membrane protein
MTINDIPPLNATLNAIATVLLTIGFVLIKQNRREAHRKVMFTACIVSAVFLIGYLTHKTLKGIAAHSTGQAIHTQFGGEGAIRIVYYVMLISHVTLAISIAYLVPRTFSFAIKGDYERHKAWAKWTFPIWYYVSVTGVLVYFFLYQWWPAAR